MGTQNAAETPERAPPDRSDPRRISIVPSGGVDQQPSITDDDTLFDETIRHTVPPPAQVNRG
jgi:hypothetical protein